MTPYYELHVTFLAEENHPFDAVQVVEEMGWKFSRIDGDPTLGEGVKCYATTHLSKKRNSRHDVVTKLLLARQRLLETGFDVLRAKIEDVLFDHQGDAPVKAGDFAQEPALRVSQITVTGAKASYLFGVSWADGTFTAYCDRLNGGLATAGKPDELLAMLADCVDTWEQL